MLQDIKQKDLENLVKGNNILAWDLYHELGKVPGNMCYSPYSLFSLLAMVYAGAREETSKQMASALHFQLIQEKLHPAFKSLSESLASHGTDVNDDNPEAFKLVDVNSLWGRQGYKFSSLFIDILSRYYHSGVSLLDFTEAPAEALSHINAWVKEQTEGLIPELLPEAAINSDTVFVLTSVVFFKACWSCPFEPGIIPEKFYLLDGDAVEVPMMRVSELLGYAEQDRYRAIELMYSGGNLSMVIILPDRDKYEQAERDLSSREIGSILNDIKISRVKLTMPGFKFHYSSQLSSSLSQIGMPLAFSSDANFSGMTGQKDIFIQEIFHDTFISVDENGTEAAAAAGAAVGRSAIYGKEIEVNINRPFMFLIRDIKTKTIVFIGRVQNPLQS